jgi:3'-phosphoadenosine 5'-phosphosulfate sulfotransferase (PAPS reductase)/FAD synthetase
MRMVCITRNEEKIKRQRVREILDLQPKIEEANSIIMSAFDKIINPVVAFSGGKDSLVVLDLVRKIKPNVVGVFENTTNEYPETLKYVKTVDNIIELKPEISFEECFKKYGLPVMKSKAKSHGNQCCIKLKEEPFRKFTKLNGVDLTFTGLTSDESRNRMMMLKRMGSLYFHKADKIWKCHPIHNWSDREVWQYIDLRHLPYNPIYDILGRTARCGCRFCTAYLSWKERTSQYNEKDTHILMRKQGYKLLNDFNTHETIANV